MMDFDNYFEILAILSEVVLKGAMLALPFILLIGIILAGMNSKRLMMKEGIYPVMDLGLH